jgi:predicted N-acetyltransferase YhbS
VLIRPAQPADEAAIAAIVERAYGVYVERIGMRPGPMDDDYGEQVRRGLVHVAEDGATVVGLIVLIEGEGRHSGRTSSRYAASSTTSMVGRALVIENVAVDPARQGEGIGRLLLEFAEEAARRAGIDTVALYTHEKMSENLALYAGLGYEEDERRRVEAFSRVFSRVFMSKRLASGSSGDLPMP